MGIKSIVTGLAIAATVSAAPMPQEDINVIEIVGGTAASAGDFPFIVSLQQGGSHICGGSLLNANTVLTAAHCAVGQTASNLAVRAGSLQRNSGGTLVKVASIAVHPSYSASLTNNDVAILKLASSIPTSSTVGYATLAAAGSDPAAGTVATTAGWGTTSEGGQSLPAALRKVDVPIISRTECKADYGSNKITDSTFCAGLEAGGKDSCQGDSGGPIINANTRTLIGTVSWGNGCAEADNPGVYARIGNLRSFINQYL